VDAAGILQSAIGISISVRALLGAAHAVFLTPHVSRESNPGVRMTWADEFQRTTGLLFVVAIPPLLLFSDIAVRILYAPAFLAGSSFVALFVAAEVFGMLSGTYQSLIIAGGSVRAGLSLRDHAPLSSPVLRRAAVRGGRPQHGRHRGRAHRCRDRRKPVSRPLDRVARSKGNRLPHALDRRADVGAGDRPRPAPGRCSACAPWSSHACGTER